MSYNSENYWSSSKGSDDPFEKYKSQQSARGGGLPGFRSRKKGQTTVRVLRLAAFLLVFGVLLTIYWQSSGVYSAPGSVSDAKPVPHRGRPPKPKPPKDTRQIGKEKATLVMLVRNSELKDALGSMKQIEDRFNRHYQYPWTFLNDEPFTEAFKNHTTRMASGTTEYGLIPKEQWRMPDWISEDKFQATIARMSKERVIYGDSRTYRHMCRYNSGFFFKHETLAKYDWYWRVEPNIGFYCDMTYDLFTFMRENKKRYSFVITLPEYLTTVETLWKTTQEFAKRHPEHIAKNNSLGFIATNPEKGIHETDYNLCHFWSNFEIADLNFWRGEAYQKYFEFLDKKGGFYYERWGDAPVHSIAAALFLPRDQIHFFGDVGYKHVPWGRCPSDDRSHETARCMCPFDRKESFDHNDWSCQNKWNKFHGLPENEIFE